MPSDRPSLTVTLTDGGRETLVARMTGGQGVNLLALTGGASNSSAEMIA